MAAAVIATMSGGKAEGGSRNMALGKDFVAVIEEAFNRFDEDSSGALGQVELQQLWRHVFPDLPDREVRQIADEIYQDLDPNRDGHVSWPEIELYFLGNPEGQTEVDRMLDDSVESKPPDRKELVWSLCEVDAPRYATLPDWHSTAKKTIGTVSNTAILVSIVNFVVESLPSHQSMAIKGEKGPTYALEAVCIAIFTVEFFARLSTTPSQRTFWCNFFTWVDVLAIIPFYVGAMLGDNPSGALVVLRVLRLLRLLRMLKLGRHFEAVQVLIIAISRTLYPLMVSMVGVNSIAVTLFASLIFTAEREGAEFDLSLQRWIRNNDSEYLDAGQAIHFQSIPVSMWWAWVTLTTVGFGDMYPVTGPGRAVASVAMLLGLVLMAFPLTLLASSFADTMEELKAKKRAKMRSQAFQSKLKAQACSTAVLNPDHESEVPAKAKDGTPGHDDEDRRDSMMPLAAPDGMANGGAAVSNPLDPRGAQARSQSRSSAPLVAGADLRSPPDSGGKGADSTAVGGSTEERLSRVEEAMARDEATLAEQGRSLHDLAEHLKSVSSEVAAVAAAVARVEALCCAEAAPGGACAPAAAPAAAAPAAAAAAAGGGTAEGDDPRGRGGTAQHHRPSALPPLGQPAAHPTHRPEG